MFKSITSVVLSCFMILFTMNVNVDKRYYDNSDYFKAEKLIKKRED